MTPSIQELRRLYAEYRRRADKLADGRTTVTAEWWCVYGYANIIARCISDIERHEKRAIRTYGDAAITFDAAIPPAPLYDPFKDNQDKETAELYAPESFEELQ